MNFRHEKNLIHINNKIRSIFFYQFILLILLACMHSLGCSKNNPVSVKNEPIETNSDLSNIPETIGFNIHITGPERDLGKIQESGIKIVRKDLFWNSVEQSKYIFDFSNYDKLVEGLEERGIRILFILCYGNSIYLEPENTSEGRRSYARYAAEAVKHFKGRNVWWEIWNEPNIEHFWNGPGTHNSNEFADQYVELVKQTVPEMRKADPDCYIIVGAVSCLWINSFRWLDRCFEQGLLDTDINALSVHPYGFARPELCFEEGYEYLRKMLQKYGADSDFPVLNTEVGYNAEEEYLGPKQLRLEHQAWHFVRQVLIDQMCDIKMTIWYNWNDDFGFRIVNENLSALPVFNACKFLTENLQGFHYVEKLNTGSDLDFVLVFENESQNKKLVCWTTPYNRDDTPDKARKHTINLTVNVQSDSLNLYDIYGRKSAIKVNEGKITLPISGSPLYIDY